MDDKTQRIFPRYISSVKSNSYPTPGQCSNDRGPSQRQLQNASPLPAAGLAYGQSTSVLHSPDAIMPQFTRTASQAADVQQRQRAYGRQYPLMDTASSPVGLPARSGHSTASFSFRRQHSRMSDSSWTDSTSSSTTSSGHCCVCNAASDSDLIPRRKRRRHAKSGGDKPKNFSWITCVPIVAVAVLAACLFLLALSAVARSRRLAFSVPVTHHLQEEAHPQRKGTSPTVASTSDAPVQHKLLVEEEGSEKIGKRDPSTTTAPTVKAKTLAPGLKRKHSKRARKTTPSPKLAARKNNDSNRKAGRTTKVIHLQHAVVPECREVSYTFCERSEHEFYYQPESNTCYQTNAVNVCTRGTNRFATLDHCVHSCVSTRHPADECFGKPIFTRCARRDVLSDWWHYDNSKCVPWSFRSGGCPANGSMVFPTAKECEKRCRKPHGGPRCQRPEVVACGRRHLKYPYFARVSPEDGRLRCFRSSPTTLQRHLCLVGVNRFPTFGSCVASCRQKPPT
ncbi:uncharacterized protein LOC142584932 [Dermacentor variabilis]|uniref:uncharacterized protein LOC142584932 n=1 Tax=Dermacentor variabilis TaxID=34621 RepID=UPI003F5ADE98